MGQLATATSLWSLHPRPLLQLTHYKPLLPIPAWSPHPRCLSPPLSLPISPPLSFFPYGSAMARGNRVGSAGVGEPGGRNNCPSYLIPSPRVTPPLRRCDGEGQPRWVSWGQGAPRGETIGVLCMWPIILDLPFLPLLKKQQHWILGVKSSGIMA